PRARRWRCTRGARRCAGSPRDDSATPAERQRPPNWLRPMLVSAATRTRVQLCGPLVAEIAGRRVDPLLKGGKGRTLFACLVISAERPRTPHAGTDILGPPAAPADPDGTLATLLTRLRNAVGHERVQGRGQLALDLGDGAWVDWEIAFTSVAR